MNKSLLLYPLVLAVFGLGLYLALEQGRKLQAPPAAASPAQTAAAASATPGLEPAASLVAYLPQHYQDPLTRLLGQLILIVVVTRLCGALARKAAQPRGATSQQGVEDLPVMPRQPMDPGVGRPAGAHDVGQPQCGRCGGPRGRDGWTSARHERTSDRAIDRRDWSGRSAGGAHSAGKGSGPGGEPAWVAAPPRAGPAGF